MGKEAASQILNRVFIVLWPEGEGEGEGHFCPALPSGGYKLKGLRGTPLGRWDKGRLGTL